MTQQEKAQRFRELHAGADILVLPNAWDVGTAHIFELAGFPAIATTSAGIAASLGYPDGERISRDEMLEVVSRIASAVAVPVTADVEAGYGDPVETAKAVAATGAVGMNLEDVTPGTSDRLVDLERQITILREIQGLHLPIVMNARTDIYLGNIGEHESRFGRTVQRLNAYRDAGADCLFAPGVRDSPTISALVQNVRGPLNILATVGTPPVRELQQLGVARVSIGSGAARAALGLVRRIANELRKEGSYKAMLEGQLPFTEVNEMLTRRTRHD